MQMAIQRETKLRYYVTQDENGGWIGFPIHTPLELAQRLMALGTRYPQKEDRVRIYVGDPILGEADAHEDDVFDNGRKDPFAKGVYEGYLDFSLNDTKVRLYDGIDDIDLMQVMVLPLRWSRRGCLPPTDMIVRVEHSNKRHGDVIWQHPTFHWQDQEGAEILRERIVNTKILKSGLLLCA